MAAAAFLAASYAAVLIRDAEPDWRKYVPLTIGSVLFVSTMIYYLRWNDHWFQEHANAEFQNMKLNADILRASWIAELYFEWDSKKDGQLPHEMIVSFTRGLFSESHARPSKFHPLDQLSGLVPDVAKLKVNQKGLILSTRERKEAD